MSTHRMKMQLCPICGYELDAHSGLDGADKPDKDDFSICMKCGEIMQFNEDLTLRATTNEAFQELAPKQQEDLKRAQHLIRNYLWKYR